MGTLSRAVSDDLIRSNILAGTLSTQPAGRSELAQAYDAACPEPAWAERRSASAAPHSATSDDEERPASSRASSGLHALGVTELKAAYATGATDPVAVLAALRHRMAWHRSGRDAILTMIDGAEAAAEDSRRRWAAGEPRALEGIPFGVKDIIDVGDTRVTCGSLQTGERIAPADAEIVARLKRAGAIPVAMLATTEFACGSAHNPRYGVVRNPWNANHWTGGSSTGSGAALAARLLPLALGTDTGGSIRIPAAFCGITGLKPTRGLVPRTGVASLSWTLDHVGPMARSAADLAAVMPSIAGPDGRDFYAVAAYAGDRARSDLKGLRIGVPEGWFLDMQDHAVLQAWRQALKTFESLGARLVPVDLGSLQTAHEDGYLILMAELASLQEPELDRMDAFDVGTRARIEHGRALSAIDYLRALRRRPLVQESILNSLEAVDVLVTPGPGGEATALADLTIEVNGERHPQQRVNARNTMIFDYVGLPALMLPSGLGVSGLPVAIQIVGKLFDDALCLSVGRAFQRVTDHHFRAPAEDRRPSGGGETGGD